MQISHVRSRGWNWDNRSLIAYYAYLIIQILKFRNVSVAHECICIQLDAPGSFELIKNKLFLGLMSNIFFNFFQINIKEKLHMPSCCTTQHFVPYMHINKRTTWFFSELIKTWFFCNFVPQNKLLPPSGQSIEYMLNPCRASLKHVVMHSV